MSPGITVRETRDALALVSTFREDFLIVAPDPPLGSRMGVWGWGGKVKRVGHVRPKSLSEVF